jgi:tRNA A-37 threonylcarbamoyl transferase component Bud32
MRVMAFLKINPRYRQLLKQQGLADPGDFLNLPSAIICGHPDRHVARVTLGTGPDTVSAYLKREHRVPWRDRLLNAAAGFGFVSKSSREASMLPALQRAGFCCPDWIAVGEDSEGRAFLLLRELTGAKDLRLFLEEYRHAPAGERHRFARRLGEALASLHNGGFDQPDLYSKHVLVDPANQTVSFLDWQRSSWRRHVSWRRRCRDLAALEATLASDLASARERLACLRAYCQGSETAGKKGKRLLQTSARSIHCQARRLLRQRRIREMCQVPATKAAQSVIWRDGEALCLTPGFQAALAGDIPDWLRFTNFPPRRRDWETSTWVALPQASRALLVRRSESRFLRGLWGLLRRRPRVSPEVRLAGLLFRLERYGIRAPRLLAFGQRSVSWRHMQSFLLIEPPPGALSLGEWLAHSGPRFAQRRRLIHEAAATLRRVHELHCYLGREPYLAVVQNETATAATVVLASITGLRSRRRPSTKDALRDLVSSLRKLSLYGCSRTDGLRFLLSYLGSQA